MQSCISETVLLEHAPLLSLWCAWSEQWTLKWKLFSPSFCSTMDQTPTQWHRIWSHGALRGWSGGALSWGASQHWWPCTWVRGLKFIISCAISEKQLRASYQSLIIQTSLSSIHHFLGTRAVISVKVLTWNLLHWPRKDASFAQSHNFFTIQTSMGLALNSNMLWDFASKIPPTWNPSRQALEYMKCVSRWVI